MIRTFLATFALVALLSAQAFAMELSTARANGYVGEKTDGYVDVVKAQSGVAEMVADINAKRRAEYQRISRENGQPLSVVGKLAAEQIINGLPSGALYQSTDGSWRKK